MKQEVEVGIQIQRDGSGLGEKDMLSSAATAISIVEVSDIKPTGEVEQEEEVNEGYQQVETENLKTLTAAQVAEHNKPDDLWIIIDNEVYDVSNFKDEHPGGVKGK
jgi:cytochrome b involved in lipid metabolism